ncbi:MAG: NAD(P)H-dependent oxidoreductase [Alphaproteobacteria bacterium]|nr:NAD(P)H-dependent oxidoreductase [Alphaproteobacteria bacterium]
MPGRLPLLKHKKTLIINTTIFDEPTHDSGLRAAMTTLIGEFALRYPGIEKVEHVYFYAVHGANMATCQSYLDRVRDLGLDVLVVKPSRFTVGWAPGRPT